jgi:predicted Zn finger-like uncharacterized protein
MKVECPGCEWSTEIPDEKIPVEGRKGTCPKCKTTFEVKKPIQQPITPPRTEVKPCPLCGEEILLVAKKCKHCNSMLNGTKEETLSRTTSPPKTYIKPTLPKNKRQVIIASVAGAVAVIIIIFMVTHFLGNSINRKVEKFLKTQVSLKDPDSLKDLKCEEAGKDPEGDVTYACTYKVKNSDDVYAAKKIDEIYSTVEDIITVQKNGELSSTNKKLKILSAKSDSLYAEFKRESDLYRGKVYSINTVAELNAASLPTKELNEAFLKACDEFIEVKRFKEEKMKYVGNKK